MGLPYLESYGGGPNRRRMVLRTNTIVLYFSYTTLVAFEVQPDGGIVARQNKWSPATGGHLNMLQPDHELRLSSEDFEKAFHNATRGQKILF